MKLEPEYLIPSYVLHRSIRACLDLHLCYHPAIRLAPGWAGEIVWASDSCFGKQRNRAIDAANRELQLARDRRAWPVHWRRPSAGDRTLLYKKAPTREDLQKEAWRVLDVTKEINRRIQVSRTSRKTSDKMSLDEMEILRKKASDVPPLSPLGEFDMADEGQPPDSEESLTKDEDRLDAEKLSGIHSILAGLHKTKSEPEPEDS